MRRPDWSLGLSLTIHAVIVVSALVALPHAQKFEVDDRETIPVELITEIKDNSTRQAVSPDAPPPKPDDKIAPPKVEEKPKAQPEPKAANEPTPQEEPTPPKQEPPPPDDAALKELIKEKAPEPKPAPPKPKPPKPKPVQKKPKKELNVDELAALLNKIPDAAPQQQPSDVNGTPAQGPVKSLVGADAANSADLVDYLNSATSQCWNPPTGVQEAQDLVVSIRIQFAQDGSVTGTPEIMNSSGNPLFGVAASAAVRAIMRCSPYSKLPPARYEEWRETVFNFNPANMFVP